MRSSSLSSDSLHATRRASVFRALLRVSAVAFVLGLCATRAWAIEPPAHLLFANNRDDRNLPASCTDDPRGLRTHPAIAKAIGALALPADRLALLGCAKGEFSAGSDAGFTDDDLRVSVVYPSQADLPTDQYIAALLHELGHAWQIFGAGGLAALQDKTSSDRIELGADFMAGVLAFRVGSLTPDSFQTNAEVVGRYRETSDQHGNPVQRTMAFRYGYFYDRNNAKKELSAAYADMQGEFYQQLVRRTSRAATTTAATRAPALSLDKINACTEISELWRRLDEGRKLGTCRPAEGAIERAIAGRIPAPGQLCFLADPPGGVLAGFSCVSARNQETKRFGMLYCHRAADEKIVTSFEDDHARYYADAERHYLQSASRCEGFNRDASTVSATLFSWHTLMVAKPRFGYAAHRGVNSTGSVLHGFALVDERLRAAPRAIEVIELSVGDGIRFVNPDAGERLGAWNLELDSANPMIAEMNKTYRKFDAPVRAIAHDHEIRRVAADRDTRTHATRIDEWVNVIARELASDGMKPIPQAEMDRFLRRMGKDFRTFTEESKLYGLKDEIPQQTGPLKMYFDDSHADCADGDSGIAAGVFSTIDTEPLSADYGSVDVFLLGVGKCSRPLAMRLAKERLESITERLRKHLRENP